MICQRCRVLNEQLAAARQQCDDAEQLLYLTRHELAESMAQVEASKVVNRAVIHAALAALRLRRLVRWIGGSGP